MSREERKKGMIIMKASDIKLEILATCNWNWTRWGRGVLMYAIDILDAIENKEVTEKALLNGAKDWREYSYGGYALIYNNEICRRLCTPSTIKRTKEGECNLNINENWLDVQARALYQAARLIMKIKREVTE